VGAQTEVAQPGDERPPRSVRAFVAVFLVAFAVCGLGGLEAWPLTGWKLFSSLRTSQQTVWLAVEVDRAGHETRIPFDRLPRGYGNFVLVMRDFASLPAERRLAVCHTWADAARGLASDAAEVRIYKVVRDLSRRGQAPTHTLLLACAPRGPAIA
jgi:hypothetical protein